MTGTVTLPDGTPARDVPRFLGIVADAHGRLWRTGGDGWERFATGQRHTIVVTVDGRRKTFVSRHQMICAAWHPRPDGPDRAVRFLDGDRGNVRPDNLAWSHKLAGRPPRWHDLDAPATKGRRYTPDAKAAAVAQCLAGSKPDAVAIRLRMGRSTLYAALTAARGRGNA